MMLFEIISISNVYHTESYLEIVAIFIIMNDKKRILVVLYDVEFIKLFALHSCEMTVLSIVN